MNINVAGVAVQAWAAHCHEWQAGQSFRHVPAAHRNPTLQYHLWLVRKGVVEVTSDDRRWQIHSGELFFLPASLKRVISTPEPASWLSVGLWITLFNRFNLLQNLQMPVQWRPDDGERATLDNWMEHIVRSYYRPEPHQRLMALGLSSALLGLCWPHLSSEPMDSSTQRELPPWLVDVLRRMAQEPACRITDLAHDAGFSPAQFRRAFHKWVGIAPRDYLKNRRLENARHLLETTDLPLKKIAVHIGLRDAAHFAQLFKDAYGVSPSHYRTARYEKYEPAE